MAMAAAMMAAYIKQFTAHGEPVTITRGTSSTSALGKLVVPRDMPLTDSIHQTELKAVVLNALAFAPAEGDTVTVAGRTFRITYVDDVTRRMAGALIAYELTLAG